MIINPPLDFEQHPARSVVTLRAWLGLTQRSFAAQIGRSAEVVKEWERGAVPQRTALLALQALAEQAVRSHQEQPL